MHNILSPRRNMNKRSTEEIKQLVRHTWFCDQRCTSTAESPKLTKTSSKCLRSAPGGVGVSSQYSAQIQNPHEFTRAHAWTKLLLLQVFTALKAGLHEATNKIHRHNSRRGLISIFPNPKFPRFRTLTRRETNESRLLLVRYPRQIQRKILRHRFPSSIHGK
jgi:hypothetical protein